MTNYLEPFVREFADQRDITLDSTGHYLQGTNGSIDVMYVAEDPELLGIKNQDLDLRVALGDTRSLRLNVLSDNGAKYLNNATSGLQNELRSSSFGDVSPEDSLETNNFDYNSLTELIDDLF